MCLQVTVDMNEMISCYDALLQSVCDHPIVSAVDDFSVHVEFTVLVTACHLPHYIYIGRNTYAMDGLCGSFV